MVVNSVGRNVSTEDMQQFYKDIKGGTGCRVEDNWDPLEAPLLVPGICNLSRNRSSKVA